MLSVKRKIEEAINEALGKELNSFAFSVQKSSDLSYGDYASNVALTLAKELGKNPRELAQDIVAKLQLPEEVEKVEIAGPGFINFFVKDEQVLDFLNKKIEFPRLDKRKLIIEHSSPNLFKPFHIGHLVNNTYGEALVRMFRKAGASVKALSFPSDVSPGIAKAVWGIKQMNLKDFTIEEVGKAYAYGYSAYKENEKAKLEIDKINEKIYKYLNGVENKDEIIEIYEKGKSLSLQFFIDTLAKINSKIDEFIFESEAEKIGKQIVFENTPNIFEKSEGAYIFRGSEKCNLFDNVFVNSQGFGTYLAKDLGLLKIKFEKYDFDLSITITDIEQKDHFALLLCAAKFVNPVWVEKSKYLQHGRMTPSKGKFSSRLGNVPLATDILEEVSKEAEKKIKEGGRGSLDNAEKIALAALKYNILKVSMGKSIIWDKEKAFSFEGDSGPYLLYSYARAKSVIRKADKSIDKIDISKVQTPNEIFKHSFVREMIFFDDAVKIAIDELSPHKIANYLNSLASAFNSFYANEKIIGSQDEELKLLLLERFSEIMKEGLDALGIEVLEEM